MPRSISAPATSGRRARRSAETREALFRCALKLFAERGFQATTIEDITEAADVGKGTFFNYFPSKEHIFNALGEIQVGNVRDAFEAAERGDEPVRETLLRLARGLAKEPGRSQPLMRSLVVAIQSNEAVRQIMLANLTRGRDLLTGIMAFGQERREIRADRDATELARIFQQFMFGTMVMWTLHPPSPLPEWLDGTFEVFWSGIAARPAQGFLAGKEKKS